MNIQKIADIQRNIFERNELINKYRLTGTIDREETIKKIVELRSSDVKVAEVNLANALASGSIMLKDATNEQLINEIIVQRDVLVAELGDPDTLE